MINFDLQRSASFPTLLPRPPHTIKSTILQMAKDAQTSTNLPRQCTLHVSGFALYMSVPERAEGFPWVQDWLQNINLLNSTCLYLPSSSMTVTCVAEGEPMVTTGLLSSCTLPTMGGSHVTLSSGCLKQRGVIWLSWRIWTDWPKNPGLLIPRSVLSVHVCVNMGGYITINTLADGSKVNYHKNAYGGFMLTVHDTSQHIRQ